jgi:hypothetical protein
MKGDFTPHSNSFSGGADLLVFLRGYEFDFRRDFSNRRTRLDNESPALARD